MAEAPARTLELPRRGALSVAPDLNVVSASRFSNADATFPTPGRPGGLGLAACDQTSAE